MSQLVTPKKFHLIPIFISWTLIFLITLLVSFLASLHRPPNEGYVLYFLLLLWTGLQPNIFLHKVIPKLRLIGQTNAHEHKHLGQKASKMEQVHPRQWTQTTPYPPLFSLWKPRKRMTKIFRSLSTGIFYRCSPPNTDGKPASNKIIFGSKANLSIN